MRLYFMILFLVFYVFLILFLVLVPCGLYKIADELKKIRSFYDSLKK